MAQRTKYIDLQRSYLPIDPNTLPETMAATEGEDRPEQRMPVVPYEGWNFMPTAYGYRSFFGLNSELNIDALATPARVRHVFVLQKSDLTNLLIALCDDGIFTKSGESTGAWTQAVELVDPDDGTVREWSFCIIANVLYVYRQGEAHVWSFGYDDTEFTENTPTTLNMSGQLGIFKAGGRLGFWDSDNSVAHSSYDDAMNVTPSISTGANITEITDVVGKIINIQQHGDGFIIYATKSIVGVRKDINNTFGWQAQSISGIAGIAYREQVAVGSPDTVHFAWTSIGLMKIENFKAEVVTPELYDFLKEPQTPVYLKFVEGRYLFVSISDADYINGLISFYTQTVEGETIDLSEAITIFQDSPTLDEQNDLDDDDASDLLNAYDKQLPHIVVFSQDEGCDDSSSFCTDKNYGVYKDHFVIPIDEELRLYELAYNQPPKEFSRLKSRVLGKTKYLLPDIMPIGIAEVNDEIEIAYPDDGNTALDLEDITLLTTDNDQNFLNKASLLWNKYNTYVETWMTAVRANVTKDFADEATNTESNDEEISVPVALTSSGYALVTNVVPTDNEVLNKSIKVYKDFETELGLVERTAYCLAIPSATDEMNISITDETEKSYKGPFSIMLDAASESLGLTQADFDGSFDTIAEVTAKIDTVIETAKAAFDSGGATIDYSVSGTASFDRLDDNGNTVSQSDTTDLDVTLSSGVATSYGASLKVSFNGGDNITAEPDGDTGWKRWDGILSAGLPLLGFNDGTLSDCLTNYTPQQWSPTVRICVQVKDGDNGDEYFFSGTGDDPGTALDDFTGTGAIVSNTDGVPELQTGEFTVTIKATGVQRTDQINITNTETAIANPCAVDVPKYISYSHPDSYIKYLASGVSIASSDTPPAYSRSDILDNSQCGLDLTDDKPTVDNHPVSSLSLLFPDGKFFIGDTEFEKQHTRNALGVIVSETITFPDTSFLMQVGAAVPYDILFKGSYVYDTQLKRWGKMKQDFRTLLDFYPINSTAVGTVDATRFNITGGLVNDSGEIKLFDSKPTDAYLKLGKFGLFRQGFTKLESVRVDFRQNCTGSLEIESSLDGRSVETGLIKSYDYTAVKQLIQGVGNSGRWHNIGFKGQFDLAYLECNSWAASRR